MSVWDYLKSGMASIISFIVGCAKVWEEIEEEVDEEKLPPDMVLIVDLTIES